MRNETDNRAHTKSRTGNEDHMKRQTNNGDRMSNKIGNGIGCVTGVGIAAIIGLVTMGCAVEPGIDQNDNEISFEESATTPESLQALTEDLELVDGEHPGSGAQGTSEQHATPCGFFKYWVNSSQFASYNHCGPTTIRIHADVTGGGSGNDFHLCVGPGVTPLGAGGNYLNAYYIGGAGCPWKQRSGHSPH